MEQNEIGLPAEENFSDILPSRDSEENLSEEIPINSEEIVAINVDEKNDFEIELEENKVTADLLDRKSIYLENELKTLEEEENSNSEDLENLS